jgi:hypothetical protein
MLSPRAAATAAAAAAAGAIKEGVGSAANAIKLLAKNPKQLLQHRSKRYQGLRAGSTDFDEQDNGLFDLEEGGGEDEEDEVFGGSYQGGRRGSTSLMPDTMERSAPL